MKCSSGDANYDVILFSQANVIQSAVITLSNFPRQSFPTNRIIIIVQRKACTICSKLWPRNFFCLYYICSMWQNWCNFFSLELSLGLFFHYITQQNRHESEKLSRRKKRPRWNSCRFPTAIQWMLKIIVKLKPSRHTEAFSIASLTGSAQSNVTTTRTFFRHFISIYKCLLQLLRSWRN